MRSHTQGVYHRVTCLCCVHVSKTNIRGGFCLFFFLMHKVDPSLVCDCKHGPCKGWEWRGTRAAFAWSLQPRVVGRRRPTFRDGAALWLP